VAFKAKLDEGLGCCPDVLEVLRVSPLLSNAFAVSNESNVITAFYALNNVIVLI
jgi:hypothetical protein